MQELFYEESSKVQNEGSAKRKYYICKFISIISYTLMVIWLLISITFLLDFNHFLSSLIFCLIPLVIFFLSGFFVGKVRDKMYVDFDYTFISGSIRFSKVIMNIKRKHIINFSTTEIEKIGKYGSESYKRYELSPDVKKMFLTSNITADENKNFYYIYANTSGNKYLFIIETTELFIVNILKFTNRTVVSEDLK